MDFFQHRYYRLSKVLMMVIGQWPYQSTRIKRGFLAVLIILTTSGAIPPILAIVKYRDNVKMLLESFILYGFGTISIAKLMAFVVHSQKRLKLINRIRTDWQVWARDREVNILHGYATQGEKMAIVYTDLPTLRIAMMYLVFVIAMIQPLISMIIDVLLKNDTAVREFPYPMVYYNIDEQKYFFYLITYSNVIAWFLITIIISNDVILVIYVQHVCGIFSALGHKLQRIGHNDTPIETGESPYTQYKKDMVHLASCIDRHNDAIEYANLIEASYTRTFFLTCAVGIIYINLIGLEIVDLSSDSATTIRFIPTILGTLFYFFIECHVAEKLIDHSINIRYCIYNSKWYRLSSRAQKILQFMTMRSTVPCYLTAGKMLPFSMRTFCLVLKTTISYFGFLRSTQGF